MVLTRHNFLFVDDEPLVLDALAHTLRAEPYRCRFAQSGEQALHKLADQPADVVVSDMRMPLMSGAELLREVADLYPQTIRLVLSGWADANEILDAINNGHIYRYIVKPWDDRELKTILRQALEICTLQQEKQQLLKTLQQHNRDLEERVESRTAQLLKIRNHAEIGKYASQIVHDLNNPLHGISIIVDLVRKKLSKKTPMDVREMSSWLDVAKQGVEDLNSIISGILLHARDQAHLEPVRVDINALIEQQLKFFELDCRFKEDVQKKTSLGVNLPPILGHPVQFKQVIDNLIRNAWDAMANTSEKQLTINTIDADGWIIIEVIDSGEGIQAAHIERIFSPEFSTKPVGQGTGLGLASVKTMVESYAGTINVKSQPGSGTTFTVKLPVAERHHRIPCDHLSESIPDAVSASSP